MRRKFTALVLSAATAVTLMVLPASASSVFGGFATTAGYANNCIVSGAKLCRDLNGYDIAADGQTFAGAGMGAFDTVYHVVYVYTPANGIVNSAFRVVQGPLGISNDFIFTQGLLSTYDFCQNLKVLGYIYDYTQNRYYSYQTTDVC